MLSMDVLFLEGKRKTKKKNTIANSAVHENPHRAFFGSPLEAKLLWTLTLR